MGPNHDTRATAARRVRHQARDRFFLLVFIAMVALGLLSLYYSLNWITGLIILGLVVLIGGIGWITGTLGGRER